MAIFRYFDITRGYSPKLGPASPGLVIHELFHGLGFGSGGWLDAFDAKGQRRTIIQQLKAEFQGSSEKVRS